MKHSNIHSESETVGLELLGYDDWFEANGGAVIETGFSPARIVEVHRNNYKVSDGRREMAAELSGRFLFNVESSVDYPTVGDWVGIQCLDDYTLAIVHQVLPRKSLLKRKDPGKATVFQLIAANIDYALIMQAVDSNFNVNRLERYLVMVNESRINPVVVLSKTDLISAHERTEISDRARRLIPGCPVLSISSLTAGGIAELERELKPHKTYCLLGSSGVGKTTLLNTLLGAQRFAVSDVRHKDGKGRHTTVRRQLTRLESGCLFIDTPGMRELGNFSIEGGLDETFADIVSHGSHCRYKDCTHTHEEGCAVKEAVEQGAVDKDRYNNFLKIRKESEFYDMSYSEKRKKDKAFGKMVKKFKKSARKK